MYTECPNCSVIFSMSEEDLKTHHGLVRCGRCAEVFNASWNLVDSLPDQPPPGNGSPAGGREARAADTSTAVQMKARAPDSSSPGRPAQTADGLESGPKTRLRDDVESVAMQEQPDLTGPERTVGDEATDRVHIDEERKVADETTDRIRIGEERPPDRFRGVAEADEPEAVIDVDEETAAPSFHAVPQTTARSGRELPRAGQEPQVRGAERERSHRPGVGGIPVRPKPAIKPKLGKLPDDPMVDEEIVIEAPLNLWGVDDQEGTVDTVTVDRVEDSAEPLLAAGRAGAGPIGMEASASPSTASGVDGAPAPPVRKPKRAPVSPTANDVRMVEIPYPRPIKTMAWTLAALLLFLAIVWQAREYYISDLAKVPFLRGHLEVFCDYAACTVPPRTDIKSIDLLATSVDPHPAAPGALRISANLVNRAEFAQPFPPLEITLTDKEGIVVGRRTYLPHEYLGSARERMPPNVVRRIDIDLAQPPDSAVGYEVQLVAR